MAKEGVKFNFRTGGPVELTIEQLNEQLNKAVREEKYEEAASLKERIDDKKNGIVRIVEKHEFLSLSGSFSEYFTSNKIPEHVPFIVNANTVCASELIHDLYKLPGCQAGGYAHVIIEDDNLEDDYIKLCIDDVGARTMEATIPEEGRMACLNLLLHLERMTFEERKSAIVLYNEKYKPESKKPWSEWGSKNIWPFNSDYFRGSENARRSIGSGYLQLFNKIKSENLLKLDCVDDYDRIELEIIQPTKNVSINLDGKGLGFLIWRPSIGWDFISLDEGPAS